MGEPRPRRSPAPRSGTGQRAREPLAVSRRSRLDPRLGKCLSPSDAFPAVIYRMRTGCPGALPGVTARCRLTSSCRTRAGNRDGPRPCFATRTSSSRSASEHGASAWPKLAGGRPAVGGLCSGCRRVERAGAAGRAADATAPGRHRGRAVVGAVAPAFVRVRRRPRGPTARAGAVRGTGRPAALAALEPDEAARFAGRCRRLRRAVRRARWRAAGGPGRRPGGAAGRADR